MNTRTRFAPSPTGFLHIGSLRTAAYAYALAKHSQGQFILRIEDTDQKRQVEGSVEKIQEILKTFGLNWDEFYIQSERVGTGVYQQAAQKLLSDGHAFYCQCEAKNAKTGGYTKLLRDPCRDLNLTSGAVKLKVPENEIVSYQDLVVGKTICWNTSTVSDPTLLKSDGFPTYHLAVVVDDHDMAISHVLRGHDWMPSTPIHLLVYQYLDYELPQIGHLTDILDPTGGKLSKRKGNVSVETFLQQGYLPEALFNFVILMGWAPKDNREMFTLGDFVTDFSPDGFQNANPVFNTTKLDWFNGQYLRQIPDQELSQKLTPFLPENLEQQLIAKLTPLVKERLTKLSEVTSLAEFIWNPVTAWPNSKWKEFASEQLAAVKEVIVSTEDWNLESLNRAFLNLIEVNNWKTGNFFMNLRLAISGQPITPPITECIILIGQTETINRLEQVLNSKPFAENR